MTYRHKSLIRRRLGDVDPALQENKAINLSLATPHIIGILIHPEETFSFCRLVGNCTPAKGYREGLVISNGAPSKGVAGGMCQFTNLIHWMALHSPLEIVEHHHHDGIDLFPDFNRQVPFGVGTSVFHNYVDYRLKNNTKAIYQFITYTDDNYLCGELRSSQNPEYAFHILEEDRHFVKIGDDYYRRNKIYRSVIDKRTGHEISRELLKESNAKVMYDSRFIAPDLIRNV